MNYPEILLCLFCAASVIICLCICIRYRKPMKQATDKSYLVMQQYGRLLVLIFEAVTILMCISAIFLTDWNGAV